MKLVNEKGKLFGIVNLVDFLLVLAVLLVVVGVGYKILSASIAERMSPQQTLEFTARVRALHPRAQSEIEKSVGETLIAGNDYVKDAIIESVTFEPYVMQVQTDDGRIVDAVDPTRIDAIFVISAKTARNTAVIKVGTQEIRVGYGHFLKTKYMEYSTVIETVTLSD